MHIKRIHEMVEKLTEVALCELNKGTECVDTEEFGEVIDAIKDLCEAEKSALIAKEMKKCEEEDEAEEKYFMKMLKEERKDELKHMKEEFGEEDGERRFYDNYRYASGRFAPKGRGSYRPRSSGQRGYEEPFMSDMDYRAHWRDMDRSDGRMYYPDAVVRSTGTSTATGSGQPDVNPNEMNRYYTPQGNTANNYTGRDYREGRSGQSRRTYMEKKEMHPGNSMEDNKEKMESLDSYLKELGSDITEMVSGMSQKEKDMLRGKLQNLSQKIQ